ncbi:hypothetical protein D3C81_1621730 [compost metagenome]
MSDKVPPRRAVAVRVVPQAREFTQHQRQITLNRPKPLPAATKHQAVFAVLQMRSDPRMADEVRRLALVTAHSGKGRHRAPLHGRVLYHENALRDGCVLLQQVPAKARIFTAVGGLVVNQNTVVRNVPELTRDIRQNRRLGASGGRHRVIARVARRRRVQKRRRVADTAAN